MGLNSHIRIRHDAPPPMAEAPTVPAPPSSSTNGHPRPKRRATTTAANGLPEEIDPKSPQGQILQAYQEPTPQLSRRALQKPNHKGFVSPAEYDENAYMNLLIRASTNDTKRVLIGIPMTGMIRSEWAMARWGQVIPTNWSSSDCNMYMSQITPLGYNVMDARNVIAHVAMERGFEWLLFIDSDVVLPPNSFRTMNEYMLKDEIPVVFGLYFTKSDPSEPLVYRGSGTGYFRNFKIGEKFWVDGIGMGQTLIKVDILREMAKDTVTYLAGGNQQVHKIFDTPQILWTDPETSSVRTMQGTEDLAWCTRVKEGEYLAKAGYPKVQKRKHNFYCDSTITAMHIRETGEMFPKRWVW